MSVEEMLNKTKDEIEAEIARLEAEASKAAQIIEHSAIVQRLIQAQQNHATVTAAAQKAVSDLKSLAGETAPAPSA